VKDSFDFSGFFCDVMLGDLAKWLRILGLKVNYDNKADDNLIVYTAKRENLLIITKDRELARRKGVDAILIETDGIEDMIKEVLLKTGIKLSDLKPFKYCPVCGSKLEKRDRDDVRWFVPQKVYEEFSEFFVCNNCVKVYWKGTHFKKIEAFVENLRSRL